MPTRFLTSNSTKHLADPGAQGNSLPVFPSGCAISVLATSIFAWLGKSFDANWSSNGAVMTASVCRCSLEMQGALPKEELGRGVRGHPMKDEGIA